MTPEQMRAAYHTDPRVSPAITAFRAFLTTGKAAEDAFYAWLGDPMTQRVLQVLEEFSDNPPVPSGSDIAVQYGVTTGLQMAIKVMAQPKRLFPEVFQDARTEAPADLGAYTVNADAAIDKM